MRQGCFAVVELHAIPITIAAKKDNTMRIAAKYAHVWESFHLAPINERFESICEKINRNGDRKIVKSVEPDIILSLNLNQI